MVGKVVKFGLTLVGGAVAFTAWAIFGDNLEREEIEEKCRAHAKEKGSLQLDQLQVEMKIFVKNNLDGWIRRLTFASSVTELRDWLKLQGWLE